MQYTADSLYWYAKNKSPKYSFSQIIHGDIEFEDNRSGEEIAADVIKSIGLELKQ